MKAISCDKIVGAKIWTNDDNFHRITYGIGAIRNPNNSLRYIEFKSIDDVNEFIKFLKQIKKDFIELEKNGHL